MASQFRRSHHQSLTRFDLLSQLYRIGDDWVAIGEIASKLMASGGNITGLLDRMVADDLIERRANPRAAKAFIDAFTMWLVRDPEDLDVVVLPNMFGDIATDLASVLQGGLGMAASANIGDEHMLFEPVHGSSPKYAGQDKVNPIAAISSVQLMFDNLGVRHDDSDAMLCADILETAISSHLAEGGVVTYDLGGAASTSEVGQAIAERCKALLQEHYASA